MPVKFGTGSSAASVAGSTNQAQDNGLLTWPYDPISAQAGSAIAAGGLILTRLPVRGSVTFATATVIIFVAGSGGSMANCFLGVYDAAGVLRGKTADQAAAWASTGGKAPAALTAEAGQSLSFTAADSYVWWAGYIGTQATTPAQFARPGSSGFANFALTGTTTPPARSLNKVVGGSALPATVDLSTFSTNSVYWGGLG